MLFRTLNSIFERPEPYSVYTAEELWTNPHTSQQMLKYHLNNNVEAASRNKAFIERSSQWILNNFNCDKNTRIADFGCGPGFYVDHFATISNKVTGIDFSRNSLDYAEKTVNADTKRVNFVHCNYLEYTPENPLDLITMIMCDFCALSPDQRKRLLSIFTRSLAPKGRVLLDVCSLSAFQNRDESSCCEPNQLNSFWSESPYFGFQNTFKYQKSKVILDKYFIIDEHRQQTIYNWLQYYSKESLAAELKESGFKIVEQYADVSGSTFKRDSDEFAVVIKKID